MTLVVAYRWADDDVYLVGDTRLVYSNDVILNERSKIFETGDGYIGFAGDGAVAEEMRSAIDDVWNLSADTLRQVARDVHSSSCARHEGRDVVPEADMLAVTRGGTITLVCSSGSACELTDDIVAIGSGEKFAYGFWHSRFQWQDPMLFGQAMLRACSEIDPNVGRKAMVVKV